jgi:hypothetical protein
MLTRKDIRTQSDRFIETARDLGCDEHEAAIRDKLRMIARQKLKEPTVVTKAAG